jgi:hypothetical protein
VPVPRTAAAALEIAAKGRWMLALPLRQGCQDGGQKDGAQARVTRAARLVSSSSPADRFFAILAPRMRRNMLA